MASVPVSGSRHGTARLGAWTLVPALGAGALYVLAGDLHERGCGGSFGDEPLGVVFEVATLGGMLALLIGGARRLGKGGRLDDLGRRLQGAGLVLLAIPALVGAILVVNGSNAAETVILLVVAGAWFYGLALIAADFLGLLALALRGRGAEETGALLPFYLFAVGLLVYLPIFLLGALRVSGCFR